MGFLTNIQAKAKNYCLKHGAHLIPFGGDHPIIIEAMTRTALSIGIKPTEVWTVMSSGVLSRGLQGAWPDAKVYGVRIGHNTTPREQGRAETFKSDYKFHQECDFENVDVAYIAWRYIQSTRGHFLISFHLIILSLR